MSYSVKPDKPENKYPLVRFKFVQIKGNIRLEEKIKLK